MAQVISIVNRRGGVGKTATVHAIGAGLSHRGKKVLYVDMDSQCNLSFDLGAKSSRYTSMEVLTGTTPAGEAIQTTGQGDIIPASPSLAGADTQVTGTGREYRLKEALEPLLSGYDYILIDTPPALGTATINALVASNGVVIPCQAEIHSLQGLALIYDTLEPVRKYCNPSLKVLGVVLTRYSSRSIISRDMKASIEEFALSNGTRLFPSPIRECTAIKEAQALQADIFSYAPKSNAATDYGALVEAILEEEA